MYGIFVPLLTLNRFTQIVTVFMTLTFILVFWMTMRVLAKRDLGRFNFIGENTLYRFVAGFILAWIITTPLVIAITRLSDMVWVALSN